MRKTYSTPVLRSQRINLGVFGDYGQDGGTGGGSVDPAPIKVIDTFESHFG